MKEKHKKISRVIGTCEASVHDQRCDGLATSEDHQTGRAIAGLFRKRSCKKDWNRKQTRSTENKQNLNYYCHLLKDNDTFVNLKILKKAQNGGITLDEFLELKKPYRVEALPKQYKQAELTETV